jgi:putative flippase GtrA
MADKTLGKKILKNQVVRFILSAGIGFLVDVGSFPLLYRNLFTEKKYHVWFINLDHYVLSFTISFTMGVLVNFLITRYFVFSESKSSPSKQFFRFASVAVLGYFANLGILEVFINDVHIRPLYARPAAALSLFFASYFVHKFFSFSLSLRHHAPGASSQSSN